MNRSLENFERENLTFLDGDQHPLELAGNFLKAESGVLLENGALGKGVCCTGSLEALVSGGDVLSGFSTAVCPKYILPKKTAENFQFKSAKSFNTLLEIPARSHLMDMKNADNFFSLDVCQQSGFHRASVLLVWPLFQEKFYSFVFKKFLVWWEGFLSKISLWESTISIFEEHWRIIAKNEFILFRCYCLLGDIRWRGVSDVAGIFCVFGNPLTRFSFFSAFF